MKRALLAALLAATAAVSTAVAGDAQDVDPVLQTIRQLRAQGDVVEAARQAEALVASHPDHLEAHVAFQESQTALGRRDDIVRTYRDRAQADGASADDRYLYARLLAGPAAVTEFRAALAVDPDHFWSLCGLGAELLEQGRDRQAVEPLEHAARLDAASGVPVNLLGRAAEAAHDRRGAEELYRRAFELQPDLVIARVNLGVLLVGVQRRDEALKVLDEAVRRAPRLPAALIARGTALMGAGKAVDAAKDFKAATEVNAKDVVALDLLANAYLSLERFDEAEDALLKALALAPKHAPTRVFVAYLQTSRGDLDAARASVDEALRLDADLPEALYMSGLVFERGGNAKKAESEYKRAQKAAPENAVYVRALALLYESQGRWRDAVREYQRVVKLTDSAPSSLYDLALGYWGYGKHDRAADALETLLSIDGDHLDAWLNLGVLRHRHLRDKKGAIAAYREYLRRGGKDNRVQGWLRELE